LGTKPRAKLPWLFFWAFWEGGFGAAAIMGGFEDTDEAIMGVLFFL